MQTGCHVYHVFVQNAYRQTNRFTPYIGLCSQLDKHGYQSNYTTNQVKRASLHGREEKRLSV